MGFPPIEDRMYPWDWPAWYDKENVADRNRARREMTLEEAVSRLNSPFPCACHGPPYCCINMSYIAEQLQRTAHIAIKMIAERWKAPLPTTDTKEVIVSPEEIRGDTRLASRDAEPC